MYKLLVSQNLTYKVLRHVMLFLTMVILFSLVTYSSSGESLSYFQVLFRVFSNAIVFFGYAYLTVYILIPYFLIKRELVAFFLFFLVSGIGLSALKFMFSDYIFYQAIAPENALEVNSLTLSRLIVNTKDMTFIVAVFALVKYAKDHFILESNIQELQRKGMEAELKLIEHQMDPHVIFNNFNNLYSISIYRPEHLKATVKKLKALLHYLFSDSKSSKVMLQQEIEMIENYIGLEKLRYGDRLDITLKLEGQVEGLRITPLILYSFVENCFVHGAGEDPRKSWINIELKVRDSRLFFLAANSVSDQPKDPKINENGANENSVRRLELQYPNSHRLTIRDKRNEHIVELNMSL